MNKITASSLLLVLQKLLERSIGLISTVILARILSPEDFGLIAAAMLVFWLVKTLTKAGTGSYIMQKETVSESDINSAWTLDLILNNSAYLVLILASPLVAYFYGSYELIPIVISLGFLLVIASAGNPGLMFLKRDQNYKAIVKRDVSAKIVGVSVVIPLALYLQNHWAIVAGQLISSLYGCVLSYFIFPYRPRFCTKNISEQWHFSKWLIPQAILGYFRSYVDTLILGLRFPIGDLGAYNNMKYFASMPMLQVLTPLVAPLHREMGKVQHEKEEMKFQFDITLRLLGFFAAPIATIFYLSSYQIVSIVLGAQWVEYHGIFGFLGLMIIPFILFTQSSRVLMVKHFTKTIFRYELFASVSITFLLFVLPASSAVQFSIYKVLLEFLLCSILYFYSYKIIFDSKGVLSYFFVIGPFFAVCGLVSLFDGFLFEAGSLGSLFFTCASSMVFTLFVFFLFWKFFASDKEKNLMKSILSSFKK